MKERSSILVADDEPNLLSNLAYALEAEGYAVEACSDGESAWEAFSSRRQDLVVLDILMPRLDGTEVLRRIRAVDAEVPVMFLTSKDEEFDKVLGLELGADDYLTKPFSLRELEARVKALLRRSKRRAAGLEVALLELELGDHPPRGRVGRALVGGLPRVLAVVCQHQAHRVIQMDAGVGTVAENGELIEDIRQFGVTSKHVQVAEVREPPCVVRAHRQERDECGLRPGQLARMRHDDPIFTHGACIGARAARAGRSGDRVRRFGNPQLKPFGAACPVSAAGGKRGGHARGSVAAGGSDDVGPPQTPYR